jgi:hypothetical protein
MKISARDSIRHVWWPAILGGIPGIAILVLWKHLSPPDSWREILAVVAVTGGATVVFSWFVSLESTERKRLLWNGWELADAYKHGKSESL